MLESARPLNRPPQAFWSGQLHTDQFCIFCVLGICQRYPHTHTHTQTNTYTHTHNHTLQYCHVSIYTYQCRLGPLHPFWKLRFLWFTRVLFFSAPSGKAQSVNGQIGPTMNFQPSSSHEYAKRIKKKKKNNFDAACSTCIEKRLKPHQIQSLSLRWWAFEMIKQQ